MGGKQPVPLTASDIRQHLWQIASGVNSMLHGHLNTGGLFTLTANVGSSTLTDDRIAWDSTIVLVPTTANAAAELGAGTLYMAESGRVNGSIVITHANNAQTDRTFRIVIIG